MRNYLIFIDKLFYWLYARPLWQIVAITVCLIIIWTVLGRKFSDRVAWRIINAILFVGTAAMICYLTLGKRSASAPEIKLLPLHFVFEGKFGYGAAQSMWLNVFFFVPLGLTLPFALSEEMKHKVILTIVFALLLSITIEVLQGVFGLGMAETDDVILNTIGAGVGCIAFAIQPKLKMKNEK